LDGGQLLQGLLWLIIGRAPSLMIATVIGLVSGAGILAAAFGFALFGGYPQAWWFVILAGFAVLASLAGLRHARLLFQGSGAPRPRELSCPSCRQAPPAGEFWPCRRCLKRFDVFARQGSCPRCGEQSPEVFCLNCYQRFPMAAWFPAVLPAAADDEWIE